jgi:hypothetical protein
VVNAWQVSELDLEVHLITYMGIKFKLLRYLASFQSVNSHPKWEPLIFGVRIELRTSLKTKWISNTRPTLVYTATGLTTMATSRELEPNRKMFHTHPPTIHPSIHPSLMVFTLAHKHLSSLLPFQHAKNSSSGGPLGQGSVQLLTCLLRA